MLCDVALVDGADGAAERPVVEAPLATCVSSSRHITALVVLMAFADGATGLEDDEDDVAAVAADPPDERGLVNNGTEDDDDDVVGIFFREDDCFLVVVPFGMA